MTVGQSRGNVRPRDSSAAEAASAMLVWREPASYVLSRAVMELFVQTLGQPANIKCSNQRRVDQKCNRLPTLCTKNSSCISRFSYHSDTCYFPIHSPTKHLLSAYYFPCALIGNGDTKMSISRGLLKYNPSIER